METFYIWLCKLRLHVVIFGISLYYTQLFPIMQRDSFLQGLVLSKRYVKIVYTKDRSLSLQKNDMEEDDPCG